MRNLAVRVALAGLFVVACGVAAYLLWANESRARRESQSFRTFEAAAITAGREVLELRAAQQAYVAAGQGEPYWIQKTAAHTAAVRETIAALRAAASVPDAQSAVENAAGALQDFEQMDRRAREYTRGGQKLLASDLIFADGLEIIGGIAGSVDQARALEAQAHDAKAASVRRTEIVTVASAAAVGVLAILLLTPVPRGVNISTAAAAVEAPFAPARAPVAAHDLPLAIDQGLSTEPARAQSSVTDPPLSREPVPVTAPRAPVDFGTIAKLCADLACVVDTRALPPILERTAGVLDAPGVVLWIADPDKRELSPIVTHGYPPSLVARLGTILTDAENATAAAFRTGLMQTVHADAVSNGAIAAPLVTPAGCVGVMAAEVRDEGEKDSAKLAAAAIVAAQLATLVGPPSTRAQARSEAV